MKYLYDVVFTGIRVEKGGKVGELVRRTFACTGESPQEAIAKARVRVAETKVLKDLVRQSFTTPYKSTTPAPAKKLKMKKPPDGWIEVESRVFTTASIPTTPTINSIYRRTG